MNPYIEKYINQGIPVFACYPNKTPTTKHGFLNATTDFEALQKQFFHDGLLIGIPTGKKSGIVCIDFDQGKKIPKTETIDTRTVEELKEALTDLTGYTLPETLEIETPSKGRHLLYKSFETNQSSYLRFFDEYLPIDIRANGGYICAVDGVNYSIYDDFDNDVDNLLSKLAPLPEWIENWKKQEKKSETSLVVVLPTAEIREIRSALTFVDADDRDTWIKIGMALKSTNCAAARGLWDEYSQKSGKYNPIDQTKKWETLNPKDITIASLFHVAKESGWVSTYQVSNTPIVVSNIEKYVNEFEQEKFPVELLKPGGLVGDIAQYIINSAYKPQPIFALAGALCAVGTIAGHKYQSPTGLRTNMYCLCVGPSGCGKEAPREALRKIFDEVGASSMAAVEDIASDTAIIKNLKKNPVQVYLLDEIGRFLKTTALGKNVHLHNAVSILLKVYSSANSRVSGKIFAGSEEIITVEQPCLSIYGTTVPENLYGGLHTEHAMDGFLPRMNIFETDNPRPRAEKGRRKNLITDVPVEIKDQILHLLKKPINSNPQGNLDPLNPNPLKVDITKHADELLDYFEERVDELRDALSEKGLIDSVYNRTVQSSIQIALTIAIGRDLDRPIIDEYAMNYGVRLAEHLSNHMHFIVNNYISNNERESESKKILNIIRKSPITKSGITRKTQHLQPYYRNEIINDLKEAKQITENINHETGVIEYFALKDEKKEDRKHDKLLSK